MLWGRGVHPLGWIGQFHLHKPATIFRRLVHLQRRSTKNPSTKMPQTRLWAIRLPRRGEGFQRRCHKPCPKTACSAQLRSENNNTAFHLFLRCSEIWRIQGFLCKITQPQWVFVTNAGARLGAGQPRRAPLLCQRASETAWSSLCSRWRRGLCIRPFKPNRRADA